MSVTAHQVFRALEGGEFKPVCLVVGEEPLQSSDIESKFRKELMRSDTETEFNLELWDGEHLDVPGLVNSLETLPGLFSDSSGKRLVILKQFEKVAAGSLAPLEKYLENPASDTVLLIFAGKADKRRSIYRLIDQHGYWIEISEPLERERPKWLPYFEKKSKKKIEPEAWEMLVATHRSLSLVWAEVEKISLYVGAGATIRKQDVLEFSGAVNGADVFSFVDDVILGRRRDALLKHHGLCLSGESEIKLLALIVRQFRLMDQARKLSMAGVTDPQVLSGSLGIHRFGVGPLLQKAKRYDEKQIRQCFDRLAFADYRMKLGGGGLFENFLLGFFGGS